MVKSKLKQESQGGLFEAFLRHQPPGVQRRIEKREARLIDNIQETYRKGVWNAWFKLQWLQKCSYILYDLVPQIPILELFLYAHSLDDFIQSQSSNSIYFKFHMYSDDSQISPYLFPTSSCEPNISVRMFQIPDNPQYRNLLYASLLHLPKPGSSFHVPQITKW